MTHSEDDTPDVDGSAYRLRTNLRKAGRHGAITVAILGMLVGLWALGQRLDLGLSVIPVAVVGVIACLGGASNSYYAQVHFSKAFNTAWQMERFRTPIAVALILLAVLSAAAGAFVYLETDPVQFEDDIQTAQDERQAALEAAAEADDPDEVEKHMADAAEAERDLEMLQLMQRTWRIIPSFILGTISLVGLLFGYFGLTTRPQTEVSTPDV